ncbi:MAG: protoheme IX farnesyltransferase [Deltaproteobacteria bacterium]|nr:protoheme IX farnesyltransferase [Deltaproteobacteria bacterium]
MLVHGFAIATAVATFLLILVGGLVHGTGSSLACPDWPTCYGTMIPKMEGGVAVEHSHRLAAGVVLILTLVLAALIARSRIPGHRPLRRVGWLAVGLVFAQALLGGITVLWRLPTPISTLHTATSLLFFCTVFYLAVRTRPAAAGAVTLPIPPASSIPSAPQNVEAAAPMAVNVALVTAVVVYFQMVLGGLVRHSGAALACLDIPLCRGSLWPDAHPTVLVQALHRLGGGTVALFVLVSAVVNFRAAAGRPLMRALSLAGPVLVAVQIWLGLHAVTSFLDLATVEAHLGVATALLATQVGLALGGVAGDAPHITNQITRPWLGAIRDLIELAKPRITGLVMATFAGGMWLAPGDLPRWRAIMTLIGTALIVGAANALNMFIERDVDKLMERTRRRPLPQGRLPASAALVFGTALAAIAIPLLLLAGNALTGVLGGLAFVSYVAIYTPMKRTSAAALFVGAVPGALPPLMGWTAVTGHIDAGALALFGILFLWQIPHFLAIAIYRCDDYGRAGFEILPLSIGDRPTRLVIIGSSAALVATSLVLAPLHVAGAIYSVTAALLGVGFFVWGLAGLRRAANRFWARSLFFASLVYLTLLFAALIIDRTVV